MDINELFDPNTCQISDDKAPNWTRFQYFQNKEKLEKEGVKVILVDMINYPIENSIPASNELFFDQEYPDGTYFCLYCNSWCGLGSLQTKLKEELPQHHFINLTGGIGGYKLSQI